MLVPLLELIEDAKTSVDELMAEAARSFIERLLMLSAQEVAGARRPGVAGDRDEGKGGLGHLVIKFFAPDARQKKARTNLGKDAGQREWRRERHQVGREEGGVKSTSLGKNADWGTRAVTISEIVTAPSESRSMSGIRSTGTPLAAHWDTADSETPKCSATDVMRPRPFLSHASNCIVTALYRRLKF